MKDVSLDRAGEGEGASEPRAPARWTEREVREMVRAALPPDVFARSPSRALLALPILALIVGVSAAVAVLHPPWYFALAASVVLGNAYGAATFFAHEVSHGATVQSHRLKTLIAYPSFAIFLLSPHLWTVWHNQVHHPQANIEGRDPDNFGTMDEYRRNTPLEQAFVQYAPGGGRWIRSLFFLFTCFTVQGQAVLWLKSRRIPGFGRLDRRRAGLDSAAMLAFWIALGVLLGAHGALFVVVLPMLIANFVVMSYIATNHMVSPMTAEPSTLATTLGVTTWPVIDVLHLWFSHHAEHHLFPAVPCHRYPKIRAVLRARFGDAYLTPPHGRALLTLVRTGRVYDGLDALVDPFTGSRATMASVEAALRGDAPLSTTREDVGAMLALRAVEGEGTGGA